MTETMAYGNHLRVPSESYLINTNNNEFFKTSFSKLFQIPTFVLWTKVALALDWFISINGKMKMCSQKGVLTSRRKVLLKLNKI